MLLSGASTPRTITILSQQREKKDIKILNGKKASCRTTQRATAFQFERRREHVNKAIGLNV